MNSTPLWVPLVVTGMGVFGTLAAGIAGVVITQRRTERREDKAWERQRSREHEQWARQDRQAAYTAFLDALHPVSDRILNQEESLTASTDDIENAGNQASKIAIFGTYQASAAAGDVVIQLWRCNGFPVDDGDEDDEGTTAARADLEDAIAAFEAIVRTEIVPEAARTSWVRISPPRRPPIAEIVNAPYFVDND